MYVLATYTVTALSLSPHCRYYWYTSAAEASEDIGVAARFNWQMFICLLLAWIFVYLCLFKGIQSSGKVCDKYVCVRIVHAIRRL